MYKQKRAFTLAEVLIALGVIGVVAAMTLPNVIKNYQKKVTVERLKSAYTTLYQAVRRSEVDNGTIDTWDIPINGNDYSNGKNCAEKYFIPYLKNIKKSENSKNKFYIILPNSTSVTFYPRKIQKITEIGIDINGNKGPNKLGKDLFQLILTQQAISHVDFGVQDKPGLYFYGQGHSNEYLKTKEYACSKTVVSQFPNLFCGALIMQSGWKIPDDYPW